MNETYQVLAARLFTLYRCFYTAKFKFSPFCSKLTASRLQRRYETGGELIRHSVRRRLKHVYATWLTNWFEEVQILAF